MKIKIRLGIYILSPEVYGKVKSSVLEAVNKSVHLDLKHEMNLSTVVHLGNEEFQVALVVVSICLIEQD